MSVLRYAVLNHIGVDVPHVDFLFESAPDALLTTFRCERWPPAVGDRFEELLEHRRIYLDYEGPISGDRGHVTQIEAGTIETSDLAIDPPTIALRLTSADGVIELTLIHSFADGWIVATRA